MNKDKKPILDKETEKQFLNELAQLYKKYNVSISHEDKHGSFQLDKYDSYNVAWLTDSLRQEREYAKLEEEYGECAPEENEEVAGTISSPQWNTITLPTGETKTGRLYKLKENAETFFGDFRIPKSVKGKVFTCTNSRVDSKGELSALFLEELKSWVRIEDLELHYE